MVWFGLKVYQLLKVIQCQTMFIYIKHIILKHFVDNILNERGLIFLAHR